MTFDLRTESWLPLRRLSGALEWRAPSELTDGIETDPFVEIASPRPDFDGALAEFLIGLLAAAIEPEDDDAWEDLWKRPPDPPELVRALERLPDAFDIDVPDGPAFLQDLEIDEFKDASLLPEQLLVDAPGDQGRKHNKDIFVKRDQVPVMGRAAAAMALITLQTYAPAGGRGNRTSLRGGGPLTTLIDPRPANSRATSRIDLSLWRKLWANVPTREFGADRKIARVADSPSRVFPWLAPTRVSSGKGKETLPAHGHPLQGFFGMPRRVRLSFVDEAGVCALLDRPDSRLLTGFAQRPLGVEYENWIHPLSPYSRANDGSGFIAQHGQPGGVGWKDWLGLVLGAPDGSRRPAVMVAHFQRERRERVGVKQFSIEAFGYDFDNMKARSWTSSRLPVLDGVGAHTERIRHMAARFVDAAGLAAHRLEFYSSLGLFGRKPADVSGRGPDADVQLWPAMEEPFYSEIRAAAQQTDEFDELGAARRFHAALIREALLIFDDVVRTDGIAPGALRNAVLARSDLLGELRGRGTVGRKLMSALGMPVQDAAPNSPAPERRANKGKRKT